MIDSNFVELALGEVEGREPDGEGVLRVLPLHELVLH